MTEIRPREEHLKTEEFFLLALPPAGEPGPLPAHLSACGACSRQLTEWRAAAEAMSASPEGPPPGFEKQVMEKVREMRSPRRTRVSRRRLAGLAAAACLLAAFWIGTRVGRRNEPARAARETSMSATDEADDKLLRDVSRLVSSDDEENDWRSLAPLPPAPGGNS
ncbi:MAG: hypothetical protein ACRD16_10280 [Thermoanaerobaculia bacterium]